MTLIIGPEQKIYDWSCNRHIQPDWKNFLGERAVFVELIGEAVYEIHEYEG